MRIVWRLALCVVFLGFAFAAQAGKRSALVFSAEKYEFIRPLDNPENDADAVADTLEKLGFEVTVESDRNLKKMRRALADFRDEATGSEVALIFFAGHGVEIGGENRLLPVDADASSLETLKATSLPLEEARAAVNAVAPVSLIVLDACRDDPFGGGTGGGRSAKPVSDKVRAAVKPGLGRIGKAENTLIAFSASPGETASDGEGGNSPFSDALSRYLPTDGLEIRSVLTLVQQEVYDRSRGRQLPYVESGLPKLFFAALAGALAERETLLMAMADVTADLRAEVEAVAAKNAMPLAPLYAALIGADLKALSGGERSAKLKEAAAAFVKTRDDLKALSADDPAVAKLREEAQAALDLGTFAEAQAKFGQAAAIDAKSRGALKANFVARTLSEAGTHALSGSAARAKLDYPAAISAYEKAVALYAEVDGNDPPLEDSRQRLFALEAIADMRSATGRTDLALPLYESLRGVTVRTAARFPERTTLAGNVGVVDGKIGDMRAARGDFAGAEASYRSALAVSETLAKTEPGNAFWPRDIALGHTRLADLAKSSGRIDEALKRYETARAIVEKLAAEHPESLENKRDVSLALERIGGVLIVKGDHDGAIAVMRESNGLAGELAESDPASLVYKRDLNVGHVRMGDALDGKGDHQGALAEYEKALQAAESLAAADPAAAEYQRDIAVAIERVAFIERKLGRKDAALEKYKASLVRMEKVAEADPGNIELKRFVAMTKTSIGDTLIEKGDYVGGLQIYRDDLATSEALVAANPLRAEFRRDLMVSNIRLATLGDDPAARLQKALALAEAMQQEGVLAPSDAQMPTMLRQLLETMGVKP
ncbi:MAG: caspase family protein [Phyllobacteriaceae bacterium]|nr:caspase family protein [Phyllobacteriaceae bacterium]